MTFYVTTRNAMTGQTRVFEVVCSIDVADACEAAKAAANRLDDEGRNAVVGTSKSVVEGLETQRVIAAKGVVV